ncbi:uncharacterized protein LOC141852801 [Brevipalpus obovatus]|uniref:uncharacterized protein LOC141852801 n=1 Tax=Brevipalpus obovatus TaxID=246614 RepID=UPI003D9EED09
MAPVDTRKSNLSLASGRSRATVARSLRGLDRLKGIKWWQRRPIVKNAILFNLQEGSYLAALFGLVEGFLQIILAFFDLYCLTEAAPGSRHFRGFGISFLFVYSGNEYVRYSLMVCSAILAIFGSYLTIASLRVLPALREEQEDKFINWIHAMGAFIVVRTLATLFQSIANDLYFPYHLAMLLMWILFTVFNIAALIVVVSNYQDLKDITRLENIAQVKMNTISSLNASRTLFQSFDPHEKMEDEEYNQVYTSPSSRKLQRESLFGLRGSHASEDSDNDNHSLSSPKMSHPTSTSSIPLAGLGLDPGRTLSSPQQSFTNETSLPAGERITSSTPLI